VLGSNTKAESFVKLPADADLSSFVNRLGLIGQALRILRTMTVNIVSKTVNRQKGEDYLPVVWCTSFSFSAQKDSSRSVSGSRRCFSLTVNGRV
jgi:hypothetical protein